VLIVDVDIKRGGVRGLIVFSAKIKVDEDTLLRINSKDDVAEANVTHDIALLVDG
jgi:hypothetical protein